MKLVYFTDPHARSQAPISRNDASFIDVVLLKLREVFEYARVHKADAVICGGDLTDSPQPSLGLIIKLISLLNEYSDVPFYLNAGNHDIYAHQIGTIDRTAIGLLKHIDKINIVDELTIDGKLIKFVQYYHGAEEDLKIKGKFGKCDILVTHAMVVDKPFFGDHVLYNEVDQDYKVMLCSHYHPGFGEISFEDKMIIAPGALTRTSSDSHNLTRKPSFAVIEMEDVLIGYEIIPLKCAKPADEVFFIDSVITEDNSEYKDRLFNSIESLDLSSCDLNTIVEEFCNANKIDERIKSEALLRIGY